MIFTRGTFDFAIAPLLRELRPPCAAATTERSSLRRHAPIALERAANQLLLRNHDLDVLERGSARTTAFPCPVCGRSSIRRLAGEPIAGPAARARTRQRMGSHTPGRAARELGAGAPGRAAP